MSGVIVWEGNSQLDKKQIVMISTESKNVKTGNMLQTWILRRFINPINAIHSSQDKSICGDCKHREGSCYVNVAYAPNQVWKQYKKRKYPKIDLEFNWFKNRKVRFGSYGDPTAVPIDIWDKILKVCSGHTAYSHQWAKEEFQGFKNFCMASVDSLEEMRQANLLGWRTFRVKNLDDLKLDGEVICPAAREDLSKKYTCEGCLLCDGNLKSPYRKNVVIDVHGLPYKIKKFAKLINKTQLMPDITVGKVPLAVI